MNINNQNRVQYVEAIEQLLKKLKINYNKPEAYIRAFTHKSFTNEHKKFKSYEMLEYLGDSLIGSYVAKQIYNFFDKTNLDSPGKATEIKKSVVNNTSLAQIALDLQLENYILTSTNLNDDINTSKVVSDVVESLAGCIYKDAGSAELNAFLNRILKKRIETALKGDDIHPKTKFQELLQILSLGQIKYISEEEISDNAKMFRTKLYVGDMLYGQGSGKSKRDAETNAALEGIEKFANWDDGKEKNEIN